MKFNTGLKWVNTNKQKMTIYHTFLIITFLAEVHIFSFFISGDFKSVFEFSTLNKDFA